MGLPWRKEKFVWHMRAPWLRLWFPSPVQPDCEVLPGSWEGVMGKRVQPEFDPWAVLMVRVI